MYKRCNGCALLPNQVEKPQSCVLSGSNVRPFFKRTRASNENCATILLCLLMPVDFSWCSLASERECEEVESSTWIVSAARVERTDGETEKYTMRMFRSNANEDEENGDSIL